MRLFKLVRKIDDSGISGTGEVAEGVEFDDGQVALRWLSTMPSTELHSSMEQLIKIHGHKGHTEVRYVDE